MTERIICADALDGLAQLETGSVDMCVTSPPYYGLRDYGIDGQIGLEHTPELYIDRLVEVFREVRRVLRDDGTLWVNIGDSYAGSGKGGQSAEKRSENWQPAYASRGKTYGLKPKDLVGIPWLLAFALRADGWYLRSEIIWHKPNAMPESVKDRPTRAHETVFLLSKSSSYFYNYGAIMEPAVNGDPQCPRGSGGAFRPNGGRRMQAEDILDGAALEERNKRDVWTVATKPYTGAHFAVFPPDLIRPCILAGSRYGGTVLDPFFGAGTTGLVALEEQRGYIGIELNPEYVGLARRRLETAAVQYNMFAAANDNDRSRDIAERRSNV